VPSATSRSAHQRRDAARRATNGGSVSLSLPVVGTIELPPPDHLAWYAGIGALAVAGLIEWPIAGVIAIGKALADNRHSKTLQEFGDALDQAG